MITYRGEKYVELESDLKPETFAGLQAAWMELSGSPLFDTELLSVVKFVVIPKLKEAEDCEYWFPSGKWATIQRLQRLCGAVEEEVKKKGVQS